VPRPWWLQFHRWLSLRPGNRKTKQMKITIYRRAGFTLVEIMIVVALIGLLAAIAVPNVVRARTQSQTQACINNLRQIDDATQQWGLENNRPVTATVTFTDIQPYLRYSITCPSAGSGATFATSYTLTTISEKPTCLMLPMTHILPADTGPFVKPHPITAGP
jgi:prepilin-type N-terminal cleavage/methylation domain-containing protein